MNVFRFVVMLILSGGLLLQCQDQGQTAKNNAEVPKPAAAEVKPEQTAKATAEIPEPISAATDEEPTPKRVAAIPAPKPVTAPKTAELNLGDTEVAVALVPSPKTPVMIDNNWRQRLGDYDDRRIDAPSENTSSRGPASRFFYERLSIHTYLEDLIAFNKYFKYKAFEYQITAKDSVEVSDLITDDHTDEELAYPLVREFYQSSYSSSINNPTYLPLETNGIEPDLFYDDTIAYFQQLKDLYDLLIVPQNEDQSVPEFALSGMGEELFFEEAARKRRSNKEELEESLTVIFDDAMEEEYGRIIRNRHQPSTDGTGMPMPSPRGMLVRNLEDWEKRELVAAVHNKPLPSSINQVIERSIEQNQQELAKLEEQISIVKMKYEAAASMLDSSEHAFFQRVFTLAESQMTKQEKELKDLLDFMANLDEKSCFPLLLPMVGSGITVSRMPRDDLQLTYNAAKKTCYDQVRALEVEFKRRQAEH